MSTTTPPPSGHWGLKQKSATDRIGRVAATERPSPNAGDECDPFADPAASTDPFGATDPFGTANTERPPANSGDDNDDLFTAAAATAPADSFGLGPDKSLTSPENEDPFTAPPAATDPFSATGTAKDDLNLFGSTVKHPTPPVSGHEPSIEQPRITLYILLFGLLILHTFLQPVFYSEGNHWITPPIFCQ